MINFLHISDTHYHASDEYVNVPVNKRMTFIREHFPDHVLLHTGDLTDDGTPRQYEKAWAALDDGHNACDSVLVVPGNHDFGAAGNFYSKEKASAFDDWLPGDAMFCGDNLPVVTKFDDVLVIGLDSNLETTNPFDFACGEIGAKQLNALSTILDSRGFKIVMCHHHPFVVNDPFMELKDAEALATVLYGRCDLLLFGHKHQMGHWKDRWKIPNILAADALFNADYARKIAVEGGKATIKEVKIV